MNDNKTVMAYSLSICYFDVGEGYFCVCVCVYVCVCVCVCVPKGL